MIINITSWTLRISALLALILGILFWTNNADNLMLIHIILGILVVLSLYILGGAIATRGRIGLAISAFILGLIVVIFGLTQTTLLPGAAHWVIQVLHLLLGLAAIGLGEAIGGRYRRLSVAQVP